MKRSLPFFSLPCIQREKLRIGREEVALYRRSKVEFEVYCVLACERSSIPGIYRGGRRSCSVQILRLKRDCLVHWRANRTQFVMPISFRKPTASLQWSSIVFIVCPYHGPPSYGRAVISTMCALPSILKAVAVWSVQAGGQPNGLKSRSIRSEDKTSFQ